MAQTGGGLPDVFEGETGRWVEIEAQLVWVVSVLGPDRPGVKVEAATLDQPDDVGFRTRHNHHARSLGGEFHLDGLEGRVGLGPLVVDRVDINRLHVALQHGWATEYASQCSFGHADEVIDDIELGPSLPGEEQLVRARDSDCLLAHCDHGLTWHGGNRTLRAP